MNAHHFHVLIHEKLTVLKNPLISQRHAKSIVIALLRDSKIKPLIPSMTNVEYALQRT